MSAAVIVVNYGSHELIEHGVLAGSGPDRPWQQVVLVDSFRDDAERRAAHELAERQGWTFVGLTDNPGFGAAADAGAAVAMDAGADVLLFLNPDVVAGPEVLAALIDDVEADPLAVVTPTIRSPRRGSRYTGSVIDLRDGRVRKGDPAGPGAGALGWVPATCLAVGADTYRAVGGFAHDYFMYWEDVDFSVRATARGATLRVRADLEVEHDSGGTQAEAAGRAKSPLYYRYNCRNRLLFAARHLPRAVLLRWWLRTVAVSWAVLLQGGRRQLLHPARPVAAVAAGIAGGTWAAVRELLGGRRARERRGHRRVPPPAGASPASVGAAGRDRNAGQRITVAVLTYRRPALLGALLPVLADHAAQAEALGHGDTVDLLVVDNDSDESGRSAVEAAAGSSPRPARYVPEPTPGIAAARNRALAETADQDLIVFIDDDEVPDTDWLVRLLAGWRAGTADAVTGSVVSRFAVEPDAWVRAGGFFDRRHRASVPSGALLPVAATNNLLLDRHAVDAAGVRFDEEFGLSGGSDTMFTRTLIARGATIAWCPEARVVEIVPASRLERGWLLRRALSYGTTDCRVAVRLAGSPAGRVRARAASVVHGLPRIGYGLVRWGYGGLRGSVADRALGATAVYRGAGHVLGAVGYDQQRYRRG